MKWLVLVVILELGAIGVEIAMLLDAYVHQVKQHIEEDFDGDDHDRIIKAIRCPHWTGIDAIVSVEREPAPVLGSSR